MKPQKRTRNGRARWIARYVDPTGRERSRTFDTRRAAADFIAEREREVKRGTWIDPADALTVAEVFDLWAARPLRPSTRTAYATTRGQLGPLSKFQLVNQAAQRRTIVIDRHQPLPRRRFLQAAPAGQRA